VSLYHILLDDLLAKSYGKLNREEIDEMITYASVAENLPKWRVLLTFSQAFFAYNRFEMAMYTLVNAAPISKSELSQVRENILQIAEGEMISMEDEELQWTDENFNGLLSKEHPQYKIERQLFMLIWFDCMAMERDLSGRYPSEACDMSDMAAYTAYSYSWLI
jgi:hypothetical protein